MQYVQVFERADGSIATVYTTTGPAPAGPMAREFDPDGQEIALTMHEMVLSAAGKRIGRVVRADELRPALDIDTTTRRPRVRADASAELRALRLDAMPAREIGR